MPSPLCVVVARVNNIRPHPYADRLELADVCDHQVVLPIGKYKAGDLVVYFPVDVELPDVWIDRLGCRAFLHGTKKNRVGVATIRGEKSFGLVADIPLPHGAGWQEGRNVAGYYGARKYEPPSKPVAGDIEAYDEAIDAYVEEYTHNGLSSEAVAANRRLVKAAPLLWDACIAALGYLSGEGDDNPNPAREAVYHAVREAAGLPNVVDCLLWDEVNPNRESEDE